MPSANQRREELARERLARQREVYGHEHYRLVATIASRLYQSVGNSDGALDRAEMLIAKARARWDRIQNIRMAEEPDRDEQDS